MTGRKLTKNILAAALAIAAIGYACYAYRQNFAQPTPREIAARKPATPPVRRTTAPAIARKPATQPATNTVVRRPLDPFQIPEPLSRLDGHTDTVRCLALSADKTKLVTGGNDRTVRLWDLASGRQIRIFEGHTNFVLGVGISTDGGRVISCSDDQTVRVWDANTGEQLAQLEGHQSDVFAVSFLSDSNLAVTASHDGTARIWDIEKETAIHKIDYERRICAMAINVPNNLLALGTHNGHVYLWDLKTRTQIRDLQVPTACIEALVLSTDAKKVVVCPMGNALRVIDIASGKILFQEDDAERQNVWNVALSPDGQTLALGRQFKIIFYNLKTGQRYKSFMESWVFCSSSMCFVPDSPLLITAGGGYFTGGKWLAAREDKLLVWRLPEPLP